MTKGRYAPSRGRPVGFLMAGARLSTDSALAPPGMKMRQVNRAGPKNETVIAKPKAPVMGIKQKYVPRSRLGPIHPSRLRTRCRLHDGFQPLGVILSMNFGEERKARTALAELHGAGLSLEDIVDDLVVRDMVVKTGYEACNGDVMIGLAANLPKREAAYLERKKLIGTFAAKYSLLLQWNEDGTGSLLTSAGRRVQPSGSVWTLLSCLYTIENSVAKRPKPLH